MVFGIDPVELAKKEVMKLDLNKDGKPDVIQALDGFQSACDQIAPFVARLDHHDVLTLIKAGINLLPKDKFPEADAEAFAIGTMNALRQFGKLKTFSEGVEADLTKKKK